MGGLTADNHLLGAYIDKLLWRNIYFLTQEQFFGSNGEGYIRFSLCYRKKIQKQTDYNKKQTINLQKDIKVWIVTDNRKWLDDFKLSHPLVVLDLVVLKTKNKY
jgi:hypothetical protein